LPAPECLDAVRAALSDDDALVCETASWALARVMPGPSQGDHHMLSTIEKVLILKQVDVFRQTPDDVLADVAALLEEIEVAAGETIFHKGDLGDSMYIIITGKLRVDDGDHLLNYLDESDVFGEMALLDAEPRIASVRAVEPTHLLRLDQEPFYELIADRPEVAIGLIRVLTGRLRARVRDVMELNTRMAALPNIAQNR
jgi:CRP/FNR family transcriptional regulator, cyclic AMP receptor protein